MTQHLGLFWKLLTQRSPLRALLSSHTESTSTGGEVQAGASLRLGKSADNFKIVPCEPAFQFGYKAALQKTQWTVLFNKLINWNLECLIEKFADSKGILALKTLPVILPPPVYKIGHKTFRPTIQEARTSFIDVQPSGTNMVLYLERQKEAKPFPFVLELGIAGQFFVVVNGEALEQQVVYGMPGTENSSIRFLRASIFAAED
ncbi:hypothetical protein F2P79_023971 [Pimephales promelas]|nr:hypothetical protein F2P79_023971 [Pimephales promelas]